MSRRRVRVKYYFKLYNKVKYNVKNKKRLETGKISKFYIYKNL